MGRPSRGKSPRTYRRYYDVNGNRVTSEGKIDRRLSGGEKSPDIKVDLDRLPPSLKRSAVKVTKFKIIALEKKLPKTNEQKRGPGRPRKNPEAPPKGAPGRPGNNPEASPRGPGRPRKNPEAPPKVKRPVGRPRKVAAPACPAPPSTPPSTPPRAQQTTSRGRSPATPSRPNAPGAPPRLLSPATPSRSSIPTRSSTPSRPRAPKEEEKKREVPSVRPKTSPKKKKKSLVINGKSKSASPLPGRQSTSGSAVSQMVANGKRKTTPSRGSQKRRQKKVEEATDTEAEADTETDEETEGSSGEEPFEFNPPALSPEMERVVKRSRKPKAVGKGMEPSPLMLVKTLFERWVDGYGRENASIEIKTAQSLHSKLAGYPHPRPSRISDDSSKDRMNTRLYREEVKTYAVAEPYKMGRHEPLVVFIDLDETLVHEPPENPQGVDPASGFELLNLHPFPGDSSEENIYTDCKVQGQKAKYAKGIYLRPGATELLRSLLKQQKEGKVVPVLFTAGDESYGLRVRDALLNTVSPNRKQTELCVFGYPSCVKLDGSIIKRFTDMSTLRFLVPYNPTTVGHIWSVRNSRKVLLDNNCCCSAFHLDHWIPAPPYFAPKLEKRSGKERIPSLYLAEQLISALALLPGDQPTDFLAQWGLYRQTTVNQINDE